MPLTASQIAELRPLPLTTLELEPCTTEELLAFLQLSGPPLQWSELPSNGNIITDAIAALLPSLPNLTALRSCFDWDDISSLAFLAHMPQLHTLSMDLSEFDVQTRQRVGAALAALTEPLRNLTKLRLSDMELLQLQGLELHSLDLHYSLSEPLDWLGLAVFQPPSRQLPTLQIFTYSYPEFD